VLIGKTVIIKKLPLPTVKIPFLLTFGKFQPLLKNYKKNKFKKEGI